MTEKTGLESEVKAIVRAQEISLKVLLTKGILVEESQPRILLLTPWTASKGINL